MDNDIATKYAALTDYIGQYSNAIIAYSGGVDSSLVAYVAGQVLGERAVAITSASASLKRSDLALAKALAKDWGIQHRVIVTDELEKPEYRANPTNRCLHCKTSLYTYLDELAREQTIEVVFNGTNTDDLGDHRPGLIAAQNFAVRSPLAECGFTKNDVRALARELGLENAEKPQSACLSSRFPYGTHITEELLAQVEAAEAVLLDLGFNQCRVRHHGDVARLEVPNEQFAHVLEHHSELQARIAATGYTYVAMDLGGFQSGSLNKVLNDNQIQVFNVTDNVYDVSDSKH